MLATVADHWNMNGWLVSDQQIVEILLTSFLGCNLEQLVLSRDDTKIILQPAEKWKNFVTPTVRAPVIKHTLNSYIVFFLLDTKGPTLFFNQPVPKKSGRRVRFSWRSNEHANFKCTMGNPDGFVDCGQGFESFISSDNLRRNGEHVLYVKGIDDYGNVGETIYARWIVGKRLETEMKTVGFISCLSLRFYTLLIKDFAVCFFFEDYSSLFLLRCSTNNKMVSIL